MNKAETIKNKYPQVDVVIPVYNTPPALLKACVASVLNQDYPNLQAVIVDDGSEERIARLVDSFLVQGVTVVHKKNGGLSDARNFGFSHSEGAFVYFLDSDDELASKCSISKLVERGVSCGADIVVGQYHLVNAKGFDASCASGHDWLVRCLEDGRVSFSAADQLYARELLMGMDCLFVNGLVHEDEEFTPRALIQAERVVGIADTQTYVRNAVEGSITTSATLKAAFGRCKGKLIVARSSMDNHLFDSDPHLRRLIDERALGFVLMALRSCACDLKGTAFCDDAVALASQIDFSRVRLSTRTPHGLRNWVCVKAIQLLGVNRFLNIVGILG